MLANKMMEFKNRFYNFDDLMSSIPFGAENLYDFFATVDGYIHDAFVSVYLIPSTNPKGWDTAKVDFSNACKRCYERWRINDEYGYH